MLTALAAFAAISPPVTFKDTAIVLPVSIPAEGMSKEEQALGPLLARASLLKAFQERGITVLSAGMMIVTRSETDLDFNDPTIWGTERYQLIANRWNARYVASIKVDSISYTETAVGAAGGPPAPGMTLNTTIKMVANLWDNKSKKYISENKDYEETFSVGRPGPSEKQIADEKRQAIIKASEKVFADYLGKLKKVKLPDEKKGKGGG